MTLTAEARLCGGLHAVGAAVEGKDYRETRQEEKPWHKLAARCFAQGMSNAEVASMVDCAPNTLSALLQNQWFQERIEQYMKEFGADVMEKINREAFKSVDVLINLRDDPKVSATVRSNISFNLLDRVLGKATQRVEVQGVPVSSDPIAEVERLERENASLRLA